MEYFDNLKYIEEEKDFVISLLLFSPSVLNIYFVKKSINKSINSS